MNVFMAFPKGVGDDGAVENKIAQLFQNAEIPAKLKHSKDDFQERFYAAGSWNEWTTEVATGVDYSTREQRYDVIVCVPYPDTKCCVGKASADIAKKALFAGKRVYCFDHDKFHPVNAVQAVDSENWQAGWQLILKEVA